MCFFYYRLYSKVLAIRYLCVGLNNVKKNSDLLVIVMTADENLILRQFPPACYPEIAVLPRQYSNREFRIFSQHGSRLANDQQRTIIKYAFGNFLFGKSSLILEKAMKITLFIYKRKTWKVRTKNAEFIVSRKRDRTEAYEE